MLQLTDNAQKVFAARYLQRNAAGEVIESPEELLQRVARAVAEGERVHGGAAEVDRMAAAFLEILTGLDFLPNSPTLMNAGLDPGQLSACFVIPVEDSMPGIFDALKRTALIQKSGGGTGFSFSHLRPSGGQVGSYGGIAAGPVAFMRIFDCATEQIRQGGRRRGANMGVLRVDHPDIEAFVQAKLDGHSLANFNLSVGATDAFMAAAAGGHSFALRHPRAGTRTGRVAARDLLARIAQAAWQTGDPGLLFLDAIDRGNPTPALGAIEATNPCGEVPLLPNEACTLGSINLSHMVRRRDGESERDIDWNRLAATVRLAIRFLDDVIEVSHAPDAAIAAAVHGNRKIGLGVMGFAEMLIRLEIPYASDRALAVAGDVMRFISETAREASTELAERRGVFPNWPDSVWHARGIRVRNATLTAIAPTGSIGILAGTSAGIEPLFALAYRRRALDGQILDELNPLFVQYLAKCGFDAATCLAALRAGGSVWHDTTADPAAHELFRTALEIAPADHLRIQAAFQAHVDNAVSKTVNLPRDTTPDAVEAIYVQAFELGLKGVTVYRYGSKAEQVLTLRTDESAVARENSARCDPDDCRV